MKYNVGFIEYWIDFRNRGARELLLLDILKEEIAILANLKPEEVDLKQSLVTELLHVRTVLDMQLLLKKLQLDEITNNFEINRAVEVSRIDESIERNNQHLERISYDR